MADRRPVSLSTWITLPLGSGLTKRAQARNFAYIALKRYVATCSFTERPIAANVPHTMVAGSVITVTCTWPEQFGGQDSTAETWARNALALLDLPCPVRP